MSRIAWGMLTLIGLAAVASRAWAQCPGCKWADRGEYFEGIATEQNAGGCCEVLGVHYNRAKPLASGATRVYLHFWLPSAAKPAIVAWQPDVNYLMTPKLRSFGPGLQHFSWPRALVLAPLGLSLDTLDVRVSRPSGLYYPALISTSEKPEPNGTYTFVLESGVGLVAAGTIERLVGDRLLPIRTLPQVRERFPGSLFIDWDGRDDQQRPVPGGKCVLRLKGTTEGEKPRPLDFTISFLHYEKFE